MTDAEKLAAIRARLDLLEDERADRWGASRGCAIEDIERILNDEPPLSTVDNQRDD
jgi:hypothetical protein